MTSTKWLKDLYDKHASSLYRLAYSRLARWGGNVEEAQDVVQDVFRIALENDLRNHPNPCGWLIRTTEFTCKNYARRNRKAALHQTSTTAEHDDGTYELQLPVESHESEADVRMMLESCLSNEEQQIVNAYCLEDRPAEDIAADLGVTTSSLNGRICRIRKRLKKFFS